MPDKTEMLPQLLQELKLRDEPPREYDLAEWNLILAQGLPGAENIDTAKLLDKLDDWAEKVRQETERLYHQFITSPSEFRDSQGYFCVLVLVTVLEQDLGVRYNPERVRDPKFQDPYCVDPDFKNAQDLFIHGIVDGAGGTCASMPVLYTAIGRRLGYPMKLVESAGHLFSRWDDPDGSFNGVPDRFNIDAAGNGFASLPDEHYENWPRPWNKWEKQYGWYNRSLTMHQEIGAILLTRAACLEDNGKWHDAFLACHWAYQLTEDKRYYQEAAKLKHMIVEKEKRHRRFIEDLQEMQFFRQQAERHRRNATNRRMPPHGGSCQCNQCKQYRSQLAGKKVRVFGHPENCLCFQCQHSDTMQPPAIPGLPNPFIPQIP